MQEIIDDEERLHELYKKENPVSVSDLKCIVSVRDSVILENNLYLKDDPLEENIHSDGGTSKETSKISYNN